MERRGGRGRAGRDGGEGGIASITLGDRRPLIFVVTKYLRKSILKKYVEYTILSLYLQDNFEKYLAQHCKHLL